MYIYIYVYTYIYMNIYVYITYMCIYVYIYIDDYRAGCPVSEAARMWQVAPACRLVADFPPQALNTRLRHVFA